MAQYLGGKLANGSSSEAIDQLDIPKIGRSKFDLSRIHTTTVDVGGLYPMDCIKVLLGDTIDISAAMYIESSAPLVKPLLSRVTAYIHYYYCRNTDLWKGWQNTITAGRNGKINKTIPYLRTNTYIWKDNEITGFTDTTKVASFSTAMSLSSFLGMPYHTWWKGATSEYEGMQETPYGKNKLNYRFTDVMNIINNQLPTGIINTINIPYDEWTTIKINALPFVMYQKIYRDFYLNKNLTQNNKNWFPDNEDDFILPYDTTEAASVMNNESTRLRYNAVPLNNADNEYNDDTTLPALRYRQWRGDYFTEALPWQYRGDEPAIGANILTEEDTINPIAKITPTTTFRNIIKAQEYSYQNQITGQMPTGTEENEIITLTQNQPGRITSGILSANITANAITELFTLAKFRERMAKSNGDYNMLMLAQFGQSPKMHNHNPEYIGGTRIDLNSSAITQTSETSTSSHLGEQAGRLAGLMNQHIKTFQVPDAGWIMAILSIVPDVTYANQGIERTMEGNTTLAEEYFPIFQNLPPQGIKSKEIYYNESTKNTLFGWIDRFTEYKTRQNKVSGLIQLTPEQDNYFSSRVWTRRFTKTPVLNNAFLTMAPMTIDRSIFSSPLDPAFIVQFASKIKATRRMAWKPKKAGLTGIAM